MADPTDRDRQPGTPGPEDWHELVRAAVIETAARVPETEGLHETLARVRARPAPKPARSRLAEWWAGFIQMPAPAFAALAGVVVLQAAVIAGLATHDTGDFADYRSHGASAIAEEPFLRIAFHPDAREADLRTVLRQHAADIVAGPTQLGEYFLMVPAGTVQATRDSLSTNALITSVALVDQLPDPGT